VEELRTRERAAIDAGDTAARDALFDQLVDLNHRLADYRNRRLSARTNVPLAQVNDLVRLARGDAPMVEGFLRHTRRDPDGPTRVRELLVWAQGDPYTLQRLDHLAGQFQRRWDAGGVFGHAGLAPYAQTANMQHFLQAHSFDYFREWDRPPLTGFWPLGTRRDQVEAWLLEAVQKLRDRVPRFVPPPPNQSWQEVVTLDNKLVVQVGYDGRYGWLGQFYPIQGEGVQHAARDEVNTAAIMLGRI